VLSIVLQVVFLLLYSFLLALFARLVLEMMLSYGRRWRPSRTGAAAMEVVWSVTDPALKPLRRVIPPLRLGTVSFDLVPLVLLVIVFVLTYSVVETLIIKVS
jgi:YggT family protein